MLIYAATSDGVRRYQTSDPYEVNTNPADWLVALPGDIGDMAVLLPNPDVVLAVRYHAVTRTDDKGNPYSAAAPEGLWRSRSIFLRENAILLCRDNQAEEILTYLLQNHVAKKNSRRAELLRAFHLCAVPAWYVGGTALLAGIVEKIETFDEYFKASADLIARKIR